VTNAAIYINGNSMLGKAEEVKLPDITSLMTEHKAMGMIAKIELPSGFDKLDGEVKWNSFYPDVAATMGDFFTMVPLQIRSSVETWGAGGRTEQLPLVTFITALFKKNPLGSFKQNDNAEFSSGFAAYYIRQQLAGKDIVELDVLANIYKVGGVDKLDLFRANQGG
jgi:hypothetical protein